MKDHSYYMKICFQLAKKALGNTYPNPYVGSLIIDSSGEIISKGYHKESGQDHAERDAIKNATRSIVGATLYCNLEPCCHTNKKTLPCAQYLIESQISKVVISNLDPNPAVAGKGVKLLQDAGIEVVVGIEREKGETLNEVFFHHIKKQTPFVHLKWAQTLDGKVATLNYDSKWITSETARIHVHQERALYQAILVGANTINRDNPRLTIRQDGSEICPIRIILSPNGQVDFNSNVFTDEYKERTLVIVKPGVNTPKGIRTIKCLSDQFNMNEVLVEIYKQGIYSLYVEGGAKVLNHFMLDQLFQRLSIYIAPKVLGNGLNSVQLLDYEKMDESLIFEAGKWTQVGQDMLFESSENECLQD